MMDAPTKMVVAAGLFGLMLIAFVLL